MRHAATQGWHRKFHTALSRLAAEKDDVRNRMLQALATA